MAYPKDPLVFGEGRGDVPRRRVVILVLTQVVKVYLLLSLSCVVSSRYWIIAFSAREPCNRL